MIRIYSYGFVSSGTTFTRRYLLPEKGLETVDLDEKITALEILATEEAPASIQIINLVEKLEVDPEEADQYIHKMEGASVEEGEELAARRRGLQRLKAFSPLDGQIARLEDGIMLIEADFKEREVLSVAPGRVIDIQSKQYVLVETTSARIQMAWGHGDSDWGAFRMMEEAPNLHERLTMEYRSTIVGSPEPLTEDFINAAIEFGVKGIVAPSIRAKDVNLLQDVAFPVVISQGFGMLAMDDRILKLLTSYNGRELAVVVDPTSDWRNQRPEIIIPIASQSAEPQATRSVYQTGDNVRIYQPPHVGVIGTITSLSEDPQQLDSGLWMPGAVVEMPSGETSFVAFANMERLA